jgi:hypothetical protein
MTGLVWHLSTAYNPEGWSVLCKQPARVNDRRTFSPDEVDCESCRALLDARTC